MRGSCSGGSQVLPITVYNSDFVLALRRQIAVSDRFICYALKQGHIRVLSTQSAHRSLVKAHKPPLTDMQCAFLPCVCHVVHAAACLHGQAVALLHSCDMSHHVRMPSAGHRLMHVTCGARLLCCMLACGQVKSGDYTSSFRFFSASVDRLACADREGNVAIWRLSTDEELGIRAQQELFVTLGPTMMGEAPSNIRQTSMSMRRASAHVLVDSTATGGVCWHCCSLSQGTISWVERACLALCRSRPGCAPVMAPAVRKCCGSDGQVWSASCQYRASPVRRQCQPELR